MLDTRASRGVNPTPTITVNDLRSMCAAILVAQRTRFAAVEERVAALARLGQQRHAQDARSLLAGAPFNQDGDNGSNNNNVGNRDANKANPAVPADVETTSTSLPSNNPAACGATTRSECASVVSERIACIRHELSRVEDALHYREQHPCEAATDTEAWLLRLLRPPPALRRIQSKAQASDTVENPAVVVTGPVAEVRDAAADSVAATGLDTASARPQAPQPATLVPVLVSTASQRPHSTAERPLSVSPTRRTIRRASSVNLPEFTSITSSSTEVSTETSQHPRCTSGSHVRMGDLTEAENHAENEGEDENEEYEEEARPTAAHVEPLLGADDDDEGWVVRTEEMRSECDTGTDASRPSSVLPAPVPAPLHTPNDHRLPSADGPAALPPHPPLPSNNPLERDASTVCDSAGATTTGCEPPPPSSSSAWVRPQSLGNMDDFVTSVDGSPNVSVAIPHLHLTDEERDGDGADCAGQPQSAPQRSTTPTTATTTVSDAPPHLSRAKTTPSQPHAMKASSRDGAASEAGKIVAVAASLRSGGSGDDLDAGRALPLVSGVPQLSVFERHRIRRLLGAIATDIVAVSLLMDELGNMTDRLIAPAALVTTGEHPTSAGAAAGPVTTTATTTPAATASAASGLATSAEGNPQGDKKSKKDKRDKKDKKKKKEKKEKKDRCSHTKQCEATSTQAVSQPLPASTPTSITPPTREPHSSHNVSVSDHAQNRPHEAPSAHSSVATPPTRYASSPPLEPSPPPPDQAQRSMPSLPGAAVSPPGAAAASALQAPSSHLFTPRSECASPISGLPPSGASAMAPGSILYRSPLTANRPLLTPGGGDGGPSAGGRPAPAGGGSLSASTNASAHKMQAAVSFVDSGTVSGPESSTWLRQASRGGGSRHSRLNSSSDEVFGRGDEVAPFRPSVSSHTTPRPQEMRGAQIREPGLAFTSLSGSGQLLGSPHSSGPSRRSLGGSALMDDGFGSIQSPRDSSVVGNVAVAAAATAAAAAAAASHHSRLNSTQSTATSVTKLTSPNATDTPSVAPHTSSEHALVSNHNNTNNNNSTLGGSSDTSGGGGGVPSRPMSRTASMMRRPKKLDVASSNTKEIAPLVHHYRVVSQGGASTHSVMSGSGMGHASPPVSMQPSASSFYGNSGGGGGGGGGGSVIAAHMFHTPSFESLLDDSEGLDLGSPVARPEHRRAGSLSASQMAGSPRTATDVASAAATAASSSGPLRPHASRRQAGSFSGGSAGGDSSSAMASVGPGAASPLPNAAAHDGTAAAPTPTLTPAGAAPPPPGLRGTTSSFYISRAMTPSLHSPTSQAPSSAPQPHNLHSRINSTESADPVLSRLPPHQRVMDGGSLRSRSGCASPFSVSQREHDNGVVNASLPTTILVHSTSGAGSGFSGGGVGEMSPGATHVGQRSGSLSSGDRSAQSGWTGSFGERPIGITSTSVLAADRMEESLEPPSPPPAMATVAPHAGKNIAAFLSGGDGSFSAESVDAATPRIAAADGQGHPLLTTLRPGEAHGAAAAAAQGRTPSNRSPRVTYEVDVPQLQEFLECLYTIQRMDVSEDELNSVGLVYSVPGIRAVPPDRREQWSPSSGYASSGGSEGGTDSNNWLLPVVRGSGMQQVQARDFNTYVTLVERKVREVEAVTGLALLPS